MKIFYCGLLVSGTLHSGRGYLCFSGTYCLHLQSTLRLEALFSSSTTWRFAQPENSNSRKKCTTSNGSSSPSNWHLL